MRARRPGADVYMIAALPVLVADEDFELVDTTAEQARTDVHFCPLGQAACRRTQRLLRLRKQEKDRLTGLAICCRPMLWPSNAE